MVYFGRATRHFARGGTAMAKATKTIRQSLSYPSHYAGYFAENAALFNRVVAFYFDCLQAHVGILALNNWRVRKEQYEARPARSGAKKPFRERPPVPPRTWNKSVRIRAEPVERAPCALHPAQSLDRLLLVLAQGAHARTRSARWLPDGQPFPGPHGGSLVAAYPHRKAVRAACENRRTAHDRSDTNLRGRSQSRLASRRVQR